MSTIREDQRRLDNIAKAHWNTSGEMREIWKKKWYDLIKIVARRINESKRFSTSSRKVH